MTLSPRKIRPPTVPAVPDSPLGGVPLVPSDDPLPSTAAGGAVRAAVPIAAASIPLALAGPWLAPAAFGALAAMGLPPMVQLFGLNVLLYLLFLGGAMVVARGVEGYVERTARRGEDEGRAAVAGVCLGATGVGLLTMLVAGLAQGEFTFLETGGRLIAIALGVGWMGGAGFRTVARVRGRGTERLPALYHAMRGSGVSIVTGYVLATAWSMAAMVVPWVAPTALAALLVSKVTLPSVIGMALLVTAPAAWASARWLRGRSPDAPHGALALGIASTGSLWGGFALWQVLIHLPDLSHPGAVAAGTAVLGMGWFTHLAAAWAGSASGERRRLPPSPAGAAGELPSAGGPAPLASGAGE